MLVLLFSASILTVEYHQSNSNKGSLRSRCPTCIEGNIELAVSNLHLIGFRFYPTSQPFFAFNNILDTGLLTVFSNICRGPPSTSIL